MESVQDVVGISYEIFQIELDYSVDSIVFVDDLLLVFVVQYYDQVFEDEVVFIFCNIYGVYIGEVMWVLVGGQWCYDIFDELVFFVVLDVGEYFYVFVGICYECLVNDSVVLVKVYFDQVIVNNI